MFSKNCFLEWLNKLLGVVNRGLAKIFRGKGVGTPRPLKGYPVPPAGGPRDGGIRCHGPAVWGDFLKGQRLVRGRRVGRKRRFHIFSSKNHRKCKFFNKISKTCKILQFFRIFRRNYAENFQNLGKFSSILNKDDISRQR